MHKGCASLRANSLPIEFNSMCNSDHLTNILRKYPSDLFLQYEFGPEWICAIHRKNDFEIVYYTDVYIHVQPYGIRRNNTFMWDRMGSAG